MNERTQTSKPEVNAFQKQQRAEQPAAADELRDEQLDKVSGGGGHVKVFDGRTGADLRGV